MLATRSAVFFWRSDMPASFAALNLPVRSPPLASCWFFVGSMLRSSSPARGIARPCQSISLDPWAKLGHAALGFDDAGEMVVDVLLAADQDPPDAFEWRFTRICARSFLADREYADDRNYLEPLLRRNPGEAEEAHFVGSFHLYALRKSAEALVEIFKP
jgi:hypothetical protein